MKNNDSVVIAWNDIRTDDLWGRMKKKMANCLEPDVDIAWLEEYSPVKMTLGNREVIMVIPEELKKVFKTEAFEKEMQNLSEEQREDTMWRCSKPLIERYVGKNEYRTWIQPLKLVEIDREKRVVILAAPGEAHREIVLSKYRSIIESVVTRFTCIPHAIDVVVR